MRRFEFVDGRSSKFWEVAVAGTAMTVRYGRIGTDGATLTKTFAAPSNAQAEADKLVREKTGKGYREIGGAAAPAPETTATKAAAAKASAKKLAPKTAEPSAGTFRWANWQARLKWRRGGGEKAPKLDRAAIVAECPLTKLAWEADGGKGRWSSKQLVKELKPANFERWDEKWWSALFATAAEPRHYKGRRGYRAQLEWAVRACVAFHGVAKATGLFLAAWARHLMYGPLQMLSHHKDMGSATLHQLIATADEADYRAALAIAKRYKGEMAVVAARLFDTERDLVAPALEAIARVAKSGELCGNPIPTSPLSTAEIDKLLRLDGIQGYMGQTEPATLAALTWTKLHGAAALPRIAKLFDVTEVGSRKNLMPIVRDFDSPEAFAALIDRVELKDVRPVVDAAAADAPLAFLCIGAERAHATGSKGIGAWLSRFAAAHAELVDAALAQLPDGPASVLKRLARNNDAAVVEAAPSEVPAALADPGLTARASARAAAAPSRLEPIAMTDRMVWPAKLRETWLQDFAEWEESVRDRDEHEARAGSLLPAKLRRALGVLPKRGEALLHRLGLDARQIARVMKGERLGETAFRPAIEFWGSVVELAFLPKDAALAVWESAPCDWHTYEGELEGPAARFELDFLPGLLRYIRARAAHGLTLALPFRAGAIAPLAANALRTTKKAKKPAEQWLRAHAETAALALLPLASAAEDHAKDDAVCALRWLVDSGGRADVERAARRYGDGGRALLAAVLGAAAFTPSLAKPSRKLPAFFVPGGFTRPLLRSGKALPLEAIENLAKLLAASTLDARHPALAEVREHCTQESLGRFAWDVFQAWLDSGAPPKEQWAFAALGILGDDECARRIAPLVRAWPGEAAHARAVIGLDVLGAIGTDVALMHLNCIAQKIKFKALQERARERIAALAKDRGLSTEQLADRLVPDLGLDEHGTLALDFGPRRFAVGFDEHLKPFVRDADGARLKDLPKPNKADDAALANDASARYAALKKDARTLATQQIQRLELAMATRRRWNAEEFRLFLVEHPLVRHLVRRLLWGAYADGRAPVCFRVAEDLTYADAHDAQWTLAPESRVGIVHPLELDATTAAAFGQVFADYEIIQPFRQLGRETYALSAKEAKGAEVRQFAGKEVPTGSVFGLEQRGWRRGDPQDGGWIGWFTRALAVDLEIHLQLEPGTVVGDIQFEPKQKLGRVVLQTPDGDERRLADADPILISEVMRDLDLLPSTP